MDGSWICRDYEPGDEQEIVALFGEVFHQGMSLPYWKWRFTDNPRGRAVIKLLFDGDKLIGHYAVTPTAVQVDGVPQRAVFSMSTMTHPDYGGQGIFTFLAQEVYQSCDQRGFSFVYGFPNQNSYPGFTRKLGWNDLGRRVILQKDLDVAIGSQREEGNVQEIERFDWRTDSLWEKVRGSYPVAVPRVAEFLNWRFVDNPDVDYAKYIATNERGEVAGYVVLKQYCDGKETTGHIVDMLSLDGEEAARTLLGCACDHFQRGHVPRVTCWMPSDVTLADALRREGFETGGDGPHFGIRVFDGQESCAERAEDASCWLLTMGDSDVF